ncbi:winged helix-turn-helix transcriptional regulator [Gordonia sp. DT218]|uniref:winged helix-turn-helix transcriptional regulator n=1 Tax=Gordonia sp. DT218 TaxID=3416659 RepID=UPI003CF13C0A
MPTAPHGDLLDAQCPTRWLLDRLGGKWVSMIIKLLGDSSAEMRFSHLQQHMPGVTHKMLSQTLKQLVADGLVERRVEDSVPPAVHYRLTPLGDSLSAPLAALRNWAESHMHEIDTIHANRRAAEHAE